MGGWDGGGGWVVGRRREEVEAVKERYWKGGHIGRVDGRSGDSEGKVLEGRDT